MSKEKKPVSRTEEGVVIEGVDNLLVHLAKCCSPVPGDPIIGYVTKGRGVTIHRATALTLTARRPWPGA